MKTLDELAREKCVLQPTDKTTFQRKARILQSLWRKEQGYDAGIHRGQRLGSSLPMPWARETLANYLNDAIRQVIREEVLDPDSSREKFFKPPRIFDNLLSSQPLAFNLFAVLSRDMSLATRVFLQLTDGRCQRVTKIEFEHSPGRGMKEYLDDHSAFDVYVEFVGPSGKGFIGVEVKYHEDLQNEPSRHHDRYDEVAAAMGCFLPSSLARLREKPLQQIWRDHMLAGAQLLHGDFKDGFFVLISPKDNAACNDAVADYGNCLSSTKTFHHWTLEGVVAGIKQATSEQWILDFEDRYLNFAKVDRLLG
jgi:hypothetical protein